MSDYSKSKFDDAETEALYELSMDGADDSCGDATTIGWYGLVRGPFEEPLLKDYAGGILEETDQGFVHSQLFTSKKALEKKWEHVQKLVSEAEEEAGD
jgi:hypothetical protein